MWRICSHHPVPGCLQVLDECIQHAFLETFDVDRGFRKHHLKSLSYPFVGTVLTGRLCLGRTKVGGGLSGTLHTSQVAVTECICSWEAAHPTQNAVWLRQVSVSCSRLCGCEDFQPPAFVVPIIPHRRWRPY